MSLYNDLNYVLGPYAERIKQVGSEVSALNKTCVPVGIWEENHYIQTNGSTVNFSSNKVYHEQFKNCVISVEPGESYVITAYGGATQQAWCIVNSNGNVLSSEQPSVKVIGKIITIPTNGAYLICNSFAHDTVSKIEWKPSILKIMDFDSGMVYRAANLERSLKNLSYILLPCLEKLLWTDPNGRDYYKAVENLIKEEIKVFPRIEVTYDPGENVVYINDSVDTLKDYLTVTYFETVNSEGVELSDNDYYLGGYLHSTINPIEVVYGSCTKTLLIEAIDLFKIREIVYPDDAGRLGFDTAHQFQSSGEYYAAGSARSILYSTVRTSPAMSSNSTKIVRVENHFFLPFPEGTTGVLIETDPQSYYYFHRIKRNSDAINRVTTTYGSGWIASGRTCTPTGSGDLCNVNFKPYAGSTSPTFNSIRITFQQ